MKTGASAPVFFVPALTAARLDERVKARKALTKRQA